MTRNRLMELHDTAEYLYEPSPLIHGTELKEIAVQLSDAGNLLGTIELFSREGENGMADKYTPEERLKLIHDAIFAEVSLSDIDLPEEQTEEDE